MPHPAADLKLFLSHPLAEESGRVRMHKFFKKGIAIDFTFDNVRAPRRP
jgi:hypothetical protein